MSSMRTRKIDIRGLQYHVQEWGDESKPLLLLLHGWMDCGVTYKFVAQYLAQDFFLVAPDWRGFGESEHVQGYWFPDYFADLECILGHYSPDEPVDIVAHSMGGNIALMYAGIRPNKVSRLLSLEALGMLDKKSSDTPATYRQWMDEILSNEETKIYPDIDSLKASVRTGNPNVSEDLVNELTGMWGQAHGENGEMRLKHDHAHRYMNPIRYNFEDVLALWREVTARVGIVMAADSPFYQGYQKVGRIQQAYDNLPASPKDCYVVDNAAHMVHIEQPEKVGGIIKRFFS